jgi:hypothetical protein
LRQSGVPLVCERRREAVSWWPVPWRTRNRSRRNPEGKALGLRVAVRLPEEDPHPVVDHAQKPYMYVGLGLELAFVRRHSRRVTQSEKSVRKSGGLGLLWERNSSMGKSHSNKCGNVKLKKVFQRSMESLSLK